MIYIWLCLQPVVCICAHISTVTSGVWCLTHDKHSVIGGVRWTLTDCVLWSSFGRCQHLERALTEASTRIRELEIKTTSWRDSWYESLSPSKTGNTWVACVRETRMLTWQLCLYIIYTILLTTSTLNGLCHWNRVFYVLCKHLTSQLKAIRNVYCLKVTYNLLATV